MQNAECRMQNAECRMQNAECRMQNAECGIAGGGTIVQYYITVGVGASTTRKCEVLLNFIS